MGPDVAKCRQRGSFGVFFPISGTTFPWNPLEPFETPWNPFGDILPHLAALFWHFGNFVPNLVALFGHINFTDHGSTSLNSFQTVLIRKIVFWLFWHFLATFGQKNVLMDNPRTNVKGPYSNIF